MCPENKFNIEAYKLDGSNSVEFQTFAAEAAEICAKSVLYMVEMM